MNTSRPLASTTVAWEKTPIGFLMASDEDFTLGHVCISSVAMVAIQRLG